MSHQHLFVAQDPLSHRPPVRDEGALTFLRWLYPDEPPGWITIFMLPGEHTAWFETNQFEAAATYAESRALEADVYIGVGLRGKKLMRGRGRTYHIIGLPGLYADLDIQHPVHRAANLPPTRAHTRALLDLLPPPSVVVDSGHGIQPWWLFKEAWIFQGEHERRTAAQLIHSFQAALQAIAARQGWHIDATHDLARLLRLPGTWNRKQEPVPVTVVEAHPDVRYDPGDFDRYLPAESTTHPTAPLPPSCPIKAKRTTGQRQGEEASNITQVATY
jgi:putative DNA primase/helicase